MKKLLLAALVALAPVLVFARKATPTPAPASDPVQEAVATLIVSNFQAGMSQMFDELRSMGLEIDSATIANEVVARLGNPYSQDAHREAAMTLSGAVDSIAMVRQRAFLDSAATLPGVRVLPGGVILQTIEEGTGARPTASDTVTFHYKGSLANGTVFDDSHGSEPLTGRISGLVPGMITGLQEMATGGKYVLFLPSDQAYGSRGASGVIPPNAALKFEVELISVGNPQ